MNSCSNEDHETLPYVMQSPPVGDFFESQGLFLKFETLDSVSFYCKYYPDSKGKAKYEFKDGVVKILNPYGRRLSPKETTEAYFLGFDGVFSSPNKLDIDFFFVGRYEVIQYSGKSLMRKAN